MATSHALAPPRKTSRQGFLQAASVTWTQANFARQNGSDPSLKARLSSDAIEPISVSPS
jgi:hypothetical protein